MVKRAQEVDARCCYSVKLWSQKSTHSKEKCINELFYIFCIDLHYLVPFPLGLRSSTDSNKTLDANL